MAMLDYCAQYKITADDFALLKLAKHNVIHVTRETDSVLVDNGQVRMKHNNQPGSINDPRVETQYYRFKLLFNTLRYRRRTQTHNS